MLFEFDALSLLVCLAGFGLLNSGLAEFTSHGKGRRSGKLGLMPVYESYGLYRLAQAHLVCEDDVLALALVMRKVVKAVKLK